MSLSHTVINRLHLVDLILSKDKYGIGFRTGIDENATRML